MISSIIEMSNFDSINNATKHVIGANWQADKHADSKSKRFVNKKSISKFSYYPTLLVIQIYLFYLHGFQRCSKFDD